MIIMIPLYSNLPPNILSQIHVVSFTVVYNCIMLFISKYLYRLSASMLCVFFEYFAVILTLTDLTAGIHKLC